MSREKVPDLMADLEKSLEPFTERREKERDRWQRRQAAEAVEQKLDAKGVNQHGVLMCACKAYGPIHAWEPGEWCGDRVNPKELETP